MKRMTGFAILVAAVIASAATSPGTAYAQASQAYPNRPIKMIVSFPPGGPLDVMGRLLAQQLSTRLGQVVVDNRPGAGGTLGGRAAATAEPDGYTLMLGSSAALAIGPALYKNIGYDPLKSFIPIAMFSSVPYVMVAAMNAPYKSVPELLAYAKANPGALNFGVPNGAPPHMLAEMFKMESKADVVVVPYKGAATAITDMIAGQIHGGFETTSVMFGHLHEGKVRGLAVVREQRLPELPDVPTMVELGLPGVLGSSWSGLLAPVGTPQDILDKLRAAMVATLDSDEIKATFKKLGAEAKTTSPQEFAAFIAEEHDRIGRIVRATGAKSE